MSYFSRPHGGHYAELTDKEYWHTRAITVDGCKNFVVTMGADYWDWLEVLAAAEERPVEEFYRAATRSLYRMGMAGKERGSAMSVSLAYEVEKAFQRSRRESLGYCNDDYWAGTAVTWTGDDPSDHFAIIPRSACPRSTGDKPSLRYCGSPISVSTVGFDPLKWAQPAFDFRC